MKILKVPTQVVDMQSGRVIEEKTTDFHLVLPPADRCQECAAKHDPHEPHNQQSLHYQYTFYAQHGRWPTWADAIAHCSPELQDLWKAELVRRGAWSEPEASDA